ncbi:MAG: DUF4147 domain-containing protein, partial [Deltaproteobacteria bacterium]
MRANRGELLGVYQQALAECDARRLVQRHLTGSAPDRPVEVVAIGKAAAAMYEGLAECSPIRRAFLVLPKGVEVPPGVEAVHGDHPLPGPASFEAGRRLLRYLESLHGPVVALLSGGASALCEVPRPPLGAEEVAARHRALLASGASITEVNAERRALSLLKGGGLARLLGRRLLRSLVLVDVPSGDAHVVG